MSFNKKIVIPTLAVVTVIVFAVIIYVAVASNKNPYVPIHFNFDSKTGEITFSIDEGYKIHQITASEGHYDVANYDKDTREILFPAWNLRVGEHEFVYLIIQNSEGKVTEEYNIEYEILHQSDNEIILSVRDGRSQNPGKRDMYFLDY